MLKKTTNLAVTFGLLLAPALFGQVSATPRPCAACSVPEPTAVPELGLCLAGIAVAYWLWRRKSRPTS